MIMRHATRAGLAVMLLSACGSGERDSNDDRPRVDLATAESAFAACSSCHTVEKGGRALAGPNLYGIVGQAAASTDFAYSSALRSTNIVWDEDTLDAYITNPQRTVAGTSMAYAGEADPETRAAIVTWLAHHSDK